MNIGMCDNNVEEIDDPSVWEGHEKYKTEGWGYRRPHEPECHSPEVIKRFMEAYNP